MLTVKVYSTVVRPDGVTSKIVTPAPHDPPARVRKDGTSPLFKLKRVQKATVTCEGAGGHSCKVRWDVWGY